MTHEADPMLSQMEGQAALPRKNGELVFDAPWEGRAFGMAVALRDAAFFEWSDFRDRLIAEVARAQERLPSSTYYEQWLAALECLAVERGLITSEELNQLTDEHLSAGGEAA